jgi:hypothetical protein
MFFYYVTFTENLSQIRKEGILPGEPTNRVRRCNGKTYDTGEVNAFSDLDDAIRWAGMMDWGFHHEFGNGKISIIEFTPGDSPWVTDTESGPLTPATYSGDWLNSTKLIAPHQIERVIPLTLEMIREQVAKLAGKDVTLG